MKMRASWLLIPALAIGLGACEKKEEAVAAPPAMVPAVAEVPTKTAALPAPLPTPPPVPEIIAPKINPEERAAKLGFVKFLPQDTEMVLSFQNGAKAADRVKNSKLWKLIQAQMGGDIGPFPGDDADKAAPDAAPASEPSGPAALFGREFTLALGKSTADQTSNLLTLNRRMTYFQMRMLASAFANAVKTGDLDNLAKSMADRLGPELMKDLIKDPQSGLALFDKAKMPPIYLAFKSLEADRAGAAHEVAAMVANLGEDEDNVEPVSLEINGHSFAGSKILGAKISANLAEGREDMDKELDPATVDHLLAALAKKDLVVMSGTVGDYVVVFIGGATEDFKLAADVGNSLVATDALAFSDAYSSKNLAALVYGQKAAIDTLIAATGGLADITNGLRDGLSGSGGLGDTRDLEALFKIVGEREAALRQLSGNDALGTVAYYEDGLKIESFGGTDNGMVDWKSPNRLARLGDSEDVVLFANLTADAVYDEKARAYAEALMETAYAMTLKVAETPLKSEEMAKFQKMAKTFDTKFRPDMLALWDIFSHDYSDSLGKESALVIDLKGGAPAVPGLPQTVVDKAKVPRVSMICPVVDRAKLSGSWDKLNTTLTGTLGKISEMNGSKIPMQKPISSEKNGNTTWFFPMPFFTDDFLPSVTVGDKWFVASSSKNQALDLIAKADAGGETRTGFWFNMNFRALEKYSEETAKLLAENAEAIMGKPLAQDQQKLMRDAIAVLGNLDKLTIHSRREGAVMRSSVHFKTR